MASVTIGIASLRAEADRPTASVAVKPKARRLVSLGKSDHWPRDRQGKDHYTEVEQFSIIR